MNHEADGELSEAPESVRESIFPKTPWTLVFNAKLGDNEAAGELLAKYRPALMVRALCYGLSHADAEDLVGSFFERFFARERSPLEGVDGPNSGKLRQFLQTCFSNHFKDTLRREATQKRGGAVEHVAFDDPVVEAVMAHGGLTPDEATDAAWALAWIESCKDKFFRRHADQPQAARQIFGMQATEISTKDLALQLGFTLKELRTRLARLKQSFESILRDEVAVTVSSPTQVADELIALRQALSRLSQSGVATDE